VKVRFYSYFKDLAGCAEVELRLEPGTTVAGLLEHLHLRFPNLAPMKRSTLVAVGLDYAPAEQVLRDHDEVSLFPPVQGG
jgi:molybdopterin converting factor small subunit